MGMREGHCVRVCAIKEKKEEKTRVTQVGVKRSNLCKMRDESRVVHK